MLAIDLCKLLIRYIAVGAAVAVMIEQFSFMFQYAEPARKRAMAVSCNTSSIL